MVDAALSAARLSATQLGDIIPLVDDEQWELPSACDGWRVIDVVAHLGALAHEAVDPPRLIPDGRQTASATTISGSTSAADGATQK
ncbi:maleylpyruvate isomerase N-terminal domain-containing protein [Mycolicibacterium mengxianglii]|uniref:maleylpyruvate isomerase N-terminal domain-containing protein n=1 Tax=Mycolicibacterium mengxianglii TaxID=2736649 RepID=UPI0018EEF5B1|nr:maleylpyruvate isomerase N-terminal domain-containing protein [Mycolicibacterium mengxianglii]